jgi:hypothetical protein
MKDTRVDSQTVCERGEEGICVGGVEGDADIGAVWL